MKKLSIKICGMKYPDNLREVLGLEPAVIGVIFYPESPRYVHDPTKLSEVLKSFPGTMVAGVFVEPTLNEIMTINQLFPMDVLQLHGNISPEFCRQLKEKGFKISLSFGISENFNFSQLNAFSNLVDYFLFDTKSPSHGGSGKSFNWNLLKQYDGNLDFFLSGGIGPGHLTFPEHPSLTGIDLNSRFEDAPGLKNTRLLSDYIEKIRQRYDYV